MLWRRGKSYSQDPRERVFALSDAGSPVGRTAERLRVSSSYVSKVLSRRRATGETTARPQRCHMTPLLAGLHEAISAEVAARPDATIAELRHWLRQTHSMTACEGLMHKTLAILALTLKKSHSTPPSSNARTSPRHARHGERANPV